VAWTNRSYKYGLSDEDVDHIVSVWNGKCWICREKDVADIDHDHSCCPGSKTCGECWRGALCRECNINLGHYENDRWQGFISGGERYGARHRPGRWAERYEIEIEAYLAESKTRPQGARC
jgi:hypothetical protein